MMLQIVKGAYDRCFKTTAAHGGKGVVQQIQPQPVNGDLDQINAGNLAHQAAGEPTG